MKLSSEVHAGWWQSMPAPLAGLLARLKALSHDPSFARERAAALSAALQTYIEQGDGAPLEPLPHEAELAEWYLCADYFPAGGQVSLAEQLRDIVTEHIPEDERRWLDPVKHSSLDLLELVSAEPAGDQRALTLRSLGDDRRATATADASWSALPVGSVLLTRLIASPDGAVPSHVIAGCGLAFSPADGRALFDRVREAQRDLELRSGSFGLGEWAEFTKRDGHLLLWAFAQARMDALVDAVADIEYVAPTGGPWLYALAAYEHQGAAAIRAGMADVAGFDPETPNGGVEPSCWIWRTTATVARLTLTPRQLFVECASPERLDDVKHRLASAFGYALRFRAETATPPARRIAEEDLASTEHYRIEVTAAEEQQLVRDFLESLYADWADTASLALGGQTPRHAAAVSEMRDRVTALIGDIEAHDLGRHRGGPAGYDYNRLRARIGVPEVGR